jgi:hypothetical protein
MPFPTDSMGFLDAMMTTFLAGHQQSMKASSDHHAGMMARQGDFAAQDNRMITAAVMNELFTGTDPSKYADFKASSVTPQPPPGPQAGMAGAAAGNPAAGAGS